MIFILALTNLIFTSGDTNILYANKNLMLIEATVNSELKKLYLWLVSNKLSLNINWYQYINLEMKNYVQHLGIFIDNNLS